MSHSVREMSRDDVLSIPKSDLPLIVVSDNLRSYVSWRIKRHTGGYYNHAMVMARPGMVVSQDLLLRERPVLDYLDGKHRVKFWRLSGGWGSVDRQCVLEKVSLQLSEPWWRRLYDVLGIVGQRLGIPWLNDPSRRYCSEHAGEILHCLEPDFGIAHPSPAEIDRWCKEQRETGVMEVYGVYDPSM